MAKYGQIVEVVSYVDAENPFGALIRSAIFAQINYATNDLIFLDDWWQRSLWVYGWLEQGLPILGAILERYKKKNKYPHQTGGFANELSNS